MATQLNLTPPTVTASLALLAKEFKTDFERTSELLSANLHGRRVVFNKDGKEYYPFDDWGEAASGTAEAIRPIPERSCVASTDSSCILIGETAEGSIYAVRAAVCFSAKGSVENFFRFGPMIVYLTRKNAYGLPAPIGSYELRVSLSDHMIAERVIRNSVERKVVGSLLSFDEEGMIVMGDGSLKHPSGALSDRVPLGRGGPVLIGFSKSSALVSSSGATTTVSRAAGAAYRVVDDGSVKTVLAKFSRNGLVFRLDIARDKAEDVGRVLGKVMWNDAFSVGYPESLRLAHHLSVFSRAEDTALKAYVSRRYDLRNLPAFNLRRIMLGTLGSAG